MGGLGRYISETMKGVNGSFSSKRLVTILSILMMCAGFFADLLYDLSVPEFMYNAIMYVVIAGVGFSGAEHFSKNINNGQ